MIVYARYVILLGCGYLFYWLLRLIVKVAISSLNKYLDKSISQQNKMFNEYRDNNRDNNNNNHDRNNHAAQSTVNNSTSESSPVIEICPECGLPVASNKPNCKKC